MRFAEFHRPPRRILGWTRPGRPGVKTADHAAFLEFFGAAEPFDAIDDARVRRVVDSVLGRLAAETRGRRSEWGTSGFVAHGLRLATLMVTAALLGAAVGWYTAVGFDETGRSDLLALLSAPIEHPLGL